MPDVLGGDTLLDSLLEPWRIVAAPVAYLVAIWVLRRLMSSRQPVALGFPMAIYNLTQVYISCFIVYVVVEHGTFHPQTFGLNTPRQKCIRTAIAIHYHCRGCVTWSFH